MEEEVVATPNEEVKEVVEEEVEENPKKKSKAKKRTPIAPEDKKCRCIVCKKSFRQGDMQWFEGNDEDIKSGWCCSVCFPAAELALKEKNYWKELVAYVYEAYGGAEFWKSYGGFTSIPVQLESMKKKYDMKYGGMLFALQYWYEIKENSWPEIPSVGIIPFVYTEAHHFYLECRQRKKDCTTKNVESIVTQERHIVRRFQDGRNAHTQWDIPYTDLDKLGGIE